MKDSLQTTEYGRVVATDLPFEAAIDRVKSLLKDDGFGILCEIDVTKTLQEKLGKEFRPYRILGACNPPLAHQALSTDAQLGLLLPCNVVVQTEEGHTIVSAIDTRALMSVAKNPSLLPIADEVNTRLNRVLDRIAEM
ncbi:MAG: DUF302 domain-containing protein [Vulcanimicrobiaceae bacterium]